MKLFSLLLLLSIALVCLFSLQAMWLYHTYRLHSQRIEESVDSIFDEALEKEIDLRFLELEKAIKEGSREHNTYITSFNIDHNDKENNNIISNQSAMIQHLLNTRNIHFDINKFDSLFHSLLLSNQYFFNYQINHIDSAGRMIETSGQFIGKGFKTITLPIIKGEKIYAIVGISSPAVFKTMLVILSVSILIILLIIICLVYVIKLILNQHQLNQRRRNFSHALTHDTKTPLATIHSVLRHFKNGTIKENPAMQQQYCTIAINQVRSLQSIVEQILTLASIEKKQLSLNRQSIDLPQMIQSLIDKFTIEANKTVVFQTSYNLGNSCVYADLLYLNNAISNLIDNAIKYSGNPVEIKIECTGNEKQVSIHVKDNGFGISSADQAKIFKQFERGAETKRNCINGFGIGLNYVQQVIKSHGGTVTIVSQENIGSEFILTLPV